MGHQSTWPPGGHRPRRFWRFVRRAILVLIAALILAAVPPALFVGVKCYDLGAPRPRPRSVAPPDMAGYARSEALTFLTLPEWSIVYSADEYARFVERASPTLFPYLGAVVQYWDYYASACGATRTVYPFEGGYHAMLGVIGVSFTVEHLIKGLYENTMGRATAWFGHDTAEDRFGAKVASEYATFMHTVPWHEFPFGTHLRTLWRDIPVLGSNPVRKVERRMALTTEYAAKAAYGWAIGLATRHAYAAEATTIHAQLEGASEALFKDPRVEKVRETGRGAYLVRLPRHEAFTHTALALLDRRVRFRDIAGNDDILVTTIVPASLDERSLRTISVIARGPMLTDAHRRRLALRVPVARLHEIVPELRAAGATIEHLYDY